MKLSQFNYYFDISNGLMLFNSLHEKVAVIYTPFRTSNILTNSIGFVDILLKRGLNDFLQTESSKELANIIEKKVAQRLNTDYLYLKILTTYRCNMACVYCYENNSFFSRNITNILLTKEKSDEIVDFACSIMKKKKLRYVFFSWYGGEPLLNYKSIIYISQEIISRGYKVYSEITSNLLVLKNKYFLIDELKKINVKMFAVTLDGYGVYHNNRRPLKNRKNDFNEYKETCEIISLLSQHLKVTVMIMINKDNISQIDDIIRSLMCVKNKSNIIIFIGMLENISSCLSDIYKKDIVSFSELANIRCELYKKFWDAGFPVDLKFLLGMHGTCLAVTNNSYVITPEGYITKCPDSIGNKSLYTGILKQGKETKLKDSMWSWEIPFNDKKCSKCHLLPVCVGGCNYTYKTENIRNCQFYSNDGIKIQNKSAMKIALQYFMLNNIDKVK